MRLALAQIDPTVGDLDGNVARIIAVLAQARQLGVDLVAFPELVISGYPPEDLLLKDHFLRDCRRGLDQVARHVQGLVAVVGVPLGGPDDTVANAAVVLAGGEIRAEYAKIRLPNYAVFDEQRYFDPGRKVLVFHLPEGRVAVNVCEDIWFPAGPCEEACLVGGAELVVNISMSPYHLGKGGERVEMLKQRALESGAFVGYVNGLGGQDELVFDGQSIVVSPAGAVLARGPQFEEALVVVDLDLKDALSAVGIGAAPGLWRIETVDIASETIEGRAEAPAETARGSGDDRGLLPVFTAADSPALLGQTAEVYEALCLGVRDYVRKNRFTDVVVGLSGGIDSALTACIAVDALGAERVHGVTMPSRYSSVGTRSDAEAVAENLGIGFSELPIETIFRAYLDTLAVEFAGREPDSAEENLQARVRGNLLMALSNKLGWLVLTTGNKSEMAVGYATLYGDMAGGFAVIKDVPKTMVYDLALYRNALDPASGPIPDSTMTRAPSAELRADQCDQDSLPPYEVLDAIIEAYVVRDESLEEIVAAGSDRAVVERVLGMIDLNEYKRRQAAPGVRITPKAFGKDRRLPITNRYRG